MASAVSDKISVPTCLQALHDAYHAQYLSRDPTLDEHDDAFFFILQEHSSRNCLTQVRNFFLIDALDKISLAHGQSDEISDMLHRLTSMELAGISPLSTSQDHDVIAEYRGEALLACQWTTIP
jgi:hypothetical protein